MQIKHILKRWTGITDDLVPDRSTH